MGAGRPRGPRRTFMPPYMQEVVPLRDLGNPKIVPIFGQALCSLSGTRLGCNLSLVYKLTPADTVLRFGLLRFTYPPIVSKNH